MSDDCCVLAPHQFFMSTRFDVLLVLSLRSSRPYWVVSSSGTVNRVKLSGSRKQEGTVFPSCYPTVLISPRTWRSCLWPHEEGEKTRENPEGRRFRVQCHENRRKCSHYADFWKTKRLTRLTVPLLLATPIQHVVSTYNGYAIVRKCIIAFMRYYVNAFPRNRIFKLMRLMRLRGNALTHYCEYARSRYGGHAIMRSCDPAL